MRPVTVRTVRVTRTPARMRSTSFAPTFKASSKTSKPDLTLIRPNPVMNTEEPAGEAA
ncbi:hypothetical protein [Enterovibrio calviensis]|uniref:hypothetical protein n=1 Tax=Enterovibrio calviensis TaxID=91359 RepID=UPI000B09A868|nr:hypothetical protein [Enterovibrio calviensis]